MLKLFFNISYILFSSILIFFFINMLNFKNLISEDFSYILQGPLAGGVYYTPDKPGRWKELVDSHKIIVSTKKNNIIEIVTNHEMRGFEHYILKHIVFDQEFNIISEKIFDPSISIAKSIHNISGYKKGVYILSICNLHDSWLTYFKSEVVK